MEESIKEKNSLADNKKMRFGTESIPKLLVSLAVPAIIANLVNALYNIVDQIFIGQKIGFLGNAATNAYDNLSCDRAYDWSWSCD